LPLGHPSTLGGEVQEKRQTGHDQIIPTAGEFGRSRIKWSKTAGPVAA
jgi:hypothetical protein